MRRIGLADLGVIAERLPLRALQGVLALRLIGRTNADDLGRSEIDPRTARRHGRTVSSLPHKDSDVDGTDTRVLKDT